MDLLISELSAAGFSQTSSRPGEYIIIEDSDNEPAVRAVYNAHDAARLTPQEQAEKNALGDYANLATWAKTGTAAEAETFINNQVWNGQTVAQVEAWIDTNITNITTANVAQINARLLSIRQALKLAAGAIINMRGLFVLTAKLLIYIRDLVIRFRT